MTRLILYVLCFMMIDLVWNQLPRILYFIITLKERNNYHPQRRENGISTFQSIDVQVLWEFVFKLISYKLSKMFHCADRLKKSDYM